MTHQEVWRVLKKRKYRPFKIHISQVLHVGDRDRRVAFCTFLVDQLDRNPNFLKNVIFTDECKFTNFGMFNRHNEHIWSIENPRVHQERRPQVRFGLNVWVGLLGDTIIGPYIYEENLNADAYLHFLNTFLADYLDENIWLGRLSQLWFQQDGAPPHNARRVSEKLSEMFPGRVISNNGDVQWPPRSPDLSPLDFFLWGCMKDHIYKTVPANIEELRVRIITTLRSHVRRRHVLRAVQNVNKRIRLCVQVEGDSFEHLL